MQGLFYCLQKVPFIETLKRCQNLYKQQIIFKPTETYIFFFLFCQKFKILHLQY